eukprot:1294737-Rhodomonas_salina.10
MSSSSSNKKEGNHSINATLEQEASEQRSVQTDRQSVYLMVGPLRDFWCFWMAEASALLVDSIWARRLGSGAMIVNPASRIVIILRVL